MFHFRAVSVAGCLGYDVLDITHPSCYHESTVSVAGCLGYDVLGVKEHVSMWLECFSCWLFRL